MSGTQRFRCQNLYFCTSKASKLSTLTQGGGQDSKELRNSRVCETRAGNNPFWASVLRMPQLSCACVLDENRVHRCSVLFPMYTFRIKSNAQLAAQTGARRGCRPTPWAILGPEQQAAPAKHAACNAGQASSRARGAQHTGWMPRPCPHTSRRAKTSRQLASLEYTCSRW